MRVRVWLDARTASTRSSRMGRDSTQNDPANSDSRCLCRLTSLNVPVARIRPAFRHIDSGARRRLSYLPTLDLAAYLPTRREVRVYIRVGSARADGGDDRGKVTSLRAAGVPETRL